MTVEQVEAYALHVRITEITQKLEVDDVVPADHISRSPSPAPEYDSSGRRTNTRHHRYRGRLLAEQQSLIRQAAHLIPNYRPPAGFKYTAPASITEKLYIPVKDFPEVNFIGQILGPRGRSLVDMANKSGATIVLRGRGSVKEGRGRGRDRDRGHSDRLNESMNEPLHCLITADNQRKVDRAKSLLQDTIEMATTTPEHENSRKREQLRALAVVNGTFRDDEGYRGTGDGEYRFNIVCRVCGGNGHIARDCVDRKGKLNGARAEKTPPWRKTRRIKEDGDVMDMMYSSFLSEVCPQR